MLFAAGVFSLIFVGSWEQAKAETTANEGADPGVFSLFGKTLCFPGSSLHDTKCDWRLPTVEDMNAVVTDIGERAHAPKSATKLFSTSWCWNNGWFGECSTNSEAHADDRNPLVDGKKSLILNTLGLNLCLGESFAKSDCDLRVSSVAIMQAEDKQTVQ
ncbi:MAG: hypothetical protein AAGC55_12285 [Myxococcota bacterium]